MRNLAKYVLALAVMGSGFYAAQQYRRPDRDSTTGTVAKRRPAAEPSVSRGQQPPAAASTEPLPVAALTDVDRLPLLGPDRMLAQGSSTVTRVTSVPKQPTLRSGDLAGKSPPAEAPQSPGSDTTNQDAKKQSVAKSQHKKQNSKKTTAAKPPGTVPSDEGKNEAEHPASAADLTRDKNFVPPDFAREYRPYSERFQAGKDSSSEGHAESGRQQAADSSLSGDQPKLPKAPPAADPRRHRIAEGDTLRQLAEKYLGSRDRYLDLFQANAEVLFDPQLIPIGVEIVIPDRTTVVAQAAADPMTAGDSNNHSTPGHDAARDEWSSVPANEKE